MTEDEALERILGFLAEKFPGQAEGVTAGTDLGNSILLDSLSAMEVVMYIEQAFDLDLERGDLDQFTTPENIARMIARKRS